MRKAKSVFLELARESATIALFWQRLRDRQRSGKLCSGRQGRLQVCPDRRLRAPGAGGRLTRRGQPM